MASPATDPIGTGIDAAEHLIDAIDAIASRSFRVRRRVLVLRQALEDVMSATDTMAQAIDREEADVASLETEGTAVHQHVQELRGVVSQLRADVEAGRVSEMASVKRIEDLAARLEAVTATQAGDTSEPAPAPAPAPAPQPAPVDTPPPPGVTPSPPTGA